MLRRVPQLDYLGRLLWVLRKTVGAEPGVGRIQVCGDGRDENGFGEKGRLQVGLSPHDEIGKLLDGHRERDAILAFARCVQDTDDSLRLAVNHNAAAGAAVQATFLVAEGKQAFLGDADKLAVPVNQPPLRVPVERVGIDVRAAALLSKPSESNPMPWKFLRGCRIS